MSSSLTECPIDTALCHIKAIKLSKLLPLQLHFKYTMRHRSTIKPLEKYKCRKHQKYYHFSSFFNVPELTKPFHQGKDIFAQSII